MSKSFGGFTAALFVAAFLSSQILWNPAVPVLNKLVLLCLEISATAAAILFSSSPEKNTEKKSCA